MADAFPQPGARFRSPARLFVAGGCLLPAGELGGGQKWRFTPPSAVARGIG